MTFPDWFKRNAETSTSQSEFNTFHPKQARTEESCFPSDREAFCPFAIGWRKAGSGNLGTVETGEAAAAEADALGEVETEEAAAAAVGVLDAAEAGEAAAVVETAWPDEAGYPAEPPLPELAEDFRELMDSMVPAVTIVEVFKVLSEDTEPRSSAPVVCIGI